MRKWTKQSAEDYIRRAERRKRSQRLNILECKGLFEKSQNDARYYRSLKVKESTVLNRISNLIENINYKSIYVEIKTDNDKYTLEKEKQTKIKGLCKE